MKSVASSRSDAFSRCLDHALAQAATSVPPLVDRAARALMEGAAKERGAAERKLLVAAAEVLLKRQEILRASFPQALAAAISGRESANGKQAAAGTLDFERLELMEEQQVDDTVELLRAQEQVSAAVETEMAELNALVSASLGSRVVRVSANPLVPATWVRALRDATLECEVDNAIRARWMAPLAQALGAELGPIYRLLSARMREDGVTAASFEVNPAPPRGAAGIEGAASPARSRAAAAMPRAASALTLRDLRRLLVGDGSARRRHGEPAATDATTGGFTEPGAGLTQGLTVPAAFEVLKELEESSRVFQRMRERHAAGIWKRAGGGPQAQAAEPTPAQVLSAEVTHLMLENIAADPRLLPPVAELVRSLEAPLLRLAVIDPRFFSDRAHPARVLLEEVTSRSLAWSAADDAGFVAFLAPVRDAIQALGGLAIEDADPFEFAVESLRQAWNGIADRARASRAATAQALQKADARNGAAAKIAADLRERPDVRSATPEVRRFLLGPWSQVLATTQLAGKPGAQQHERDMALVNDLIWSTQPRLTEAIPGRLAKLLPPMLATLRQGLLRIEYPAQATDAFLQRLAALQADEAVPEPAEADSADDAWLTPQEARDSALFPGTAFDNTVVEQRADVQGEREPLAIDRLVAGCLVEVKVRGAWVRWQLSWIGSSAMLFMFSNGAGKPESMTRQMLERLVSLGAVRLAADRSVVAEALDAVTQTALRNSVMQPAA